MQSQRYGSGKPIRKFAITRQIAHFERSHILEPLPPSRCICWGHVETCLCEHQAEPLGALRISFRISDHQSLRDQDKTNDAAHWSFNIRFNAYASRSADGMRSSLSGERQLIAQDPYSPFRLSLWPAVRPSSTQSAMLSAIELITDVDDVAPKSNFLAYSRGLKRFGDNRSANASFIYL